MIALINGFPEESKKHMKADLKEICWETVYRIRDAMMNGEVNPSNSERTAFVKGDDTPTNDTGALRKALTVRVVRETKEHGIAYFVGVPENEGYGSTHPGPTTNKFWGKALQQQDKKTLYQLAGMMLSGFPVYHPKTHIKIMNVPPRDFLISGKEYAQANFTGTMENSMLKYIEEFRNS
jgi:hypothetical protein